MTNASKAGSVPSDIPMLPTPVPVPIPTGTTIYGGMRIGMQIDTSVMSMDARIQLQRQFLERLGQLTGVDTDQERHLLARYLMFYLTLPPASSHSSKCNSSATCNSFLW